MSDSKPAVTPWGTGEPGCERQVTGSRQPAPQRRSGLLTTERLLFVGSCLWLAALVGLPQLLAAAPALWTTIGLLAVNLAVSLLGVYRLRRLPLSLSLAQIGLFAIVHVQVWSALGPEHYRVDHPPSWFDWAAFSGAHLLRAADVLDFLDGYGISLQPIEHHSALSGALLVGLHLSADLFLLAVLLRALKRWGECLRQRLGFARKRGGFDRLPELLLLCLAGAVLVVVLIVVTAIAQRWPWQDWLLWPLDHVLRTADVLDVMQLASWRLHGAPPSFWDSTLALVFRFFVGVLLLGYLRLLIMYHAPHVLPWTAESLAEAMTSDTFGRDWTDVVRKLKPSMSPEAQRELVRRLIEDLKTVPLEDQHHTAGQLVQLHDAGLEVVPDMLSMLQGNNPDHQLAVAHALGSIFFGARCGEGAEGLEAVEQAFLRCLGSDSPAVRNEAALALGGLYSHRHLLDLARSGEAAAPWAAVERAVSASPAVPALTRALKDPEEGVRQAAVSSLGEILAGLRDAPAVAPLLEVLEEPTQEIRWAALGALGDIRAGKAVPILLQRLARCPPGDPEAKILALKLVAIDPEQARPALPVLWRCLREGPDWDPFVVGSLAKVRPVSPELLRVLERLLRPEEVAREAALEALCDLGAAAEPVLPALLKLLRSKEERDRVLVVQALAKVAPSAAVVKEQLGVIARNDRSEWVRSVAGQTFASLARERTE
jgi:HEAT repeat protein